MADQGDHEEGPSTDPSRLASNFTSVDERSLSLAADKLVDRALSKVVVGFGIDTVESPSTQVLVPINPFPEESIARLPVSPSFIGKHTTPLPIESLMNTGHEIHRDWAKSHIENMPGFGFEPNREWAAPTNDSVGSPSPEPGLPPDAGIGEGVWPGTGEYETLMHEMSSAVATFDGISISVAYVQDLYVKVASVAQTVSTFPSTTHERTGGNTGNNRDSEGGKDMLPPEVQDRVLRTLSDIQLQLNNIKNLLMKDKGLFS